MTKPGYKFETNLLELSNSKSVDIAKKEWFDFYDEQRLKLDRQCICQRKIKNVIYMFNILTKKCITVGSNCITKFKLEKNKINNDLYENVLKKIKGEYEEIDTIDFAEKTQTYLIEDITKILNENSDLQKLVEIEKKILDLIKRFNLTFLEDLKSETNLKIIKLKQEELLKKQLEEQLKKQQEEEKLKKQEEQLKKQQEEQLEKQQEEQLEKQHKELRKEFEELRKKYDKVNREKQIVLEKLKKQEEKQNKKNEKEIVEEYNNHLNFQEFCEHWK